MRWDVLLKVALHSKAVWFLMARRGCRNVASNRGDNLDKKSESYVPEYFVWRAEQISFQSFSNCKLKIM